MNKDDKLKPKLNLEQDCLNQQNPKKQKINTYIKPNLQLKKPVDKSASSFEF